MTQGAPRLVPAILCGGSGTRLWPLSRSARPKQLHALVGDKSLLAETIERALTLPGARAADVILLAGDSFPLDALRAEALAGGAPEAQIIAEPEARNTAAAAALACFAALERGEDCVILLLPSDHHIADASAFARAVADGEKLAAQNFVVTFGIEPTGPNTGYGYIARGAPLDVGFKVARFQEKPDLETAQRLLAEGGYSWNSGIYMFRPQTYLDELGRFEPQVRAQAEAAWRGGASPDAGGIGGVRRLDAKAWALSPSISIDNAVAERTARAAVLPTSMAWSDIGSWAALWDIAEKDARGNVMIGGVASIDAKNNYVRAEHRTIALIGVEDLVVIETGDVVAIAPRARVEEIKKLVEHLSAQGRKDIL